MAGEMFGAIIKYTGAVPKIALRRRNEVYKEAYGVVLTYWHAELRPKHFTHAGATEYRYAPRKGEARSGRSFKGSYTARKLQKFGHTRPLEFTGVSKALTGQRNVTSTSKGGRCRMYAPALNWHHPRSQVFARDELSRVSDAERQLLQEMFDREVGKRFAAITDTETTRI